MTAHRGSDQGTDPFSIYASDSAEDAPARNDEPTPIDPLIGLDRRARRALTQNLAVGESVLAVVRGSGQCALIATDRRAFIFKAGLAAGTTFGSKVASFDYRNIGGVQVHTSAFTGSVVLDIAGAAPVGSRCWGNKDNDPWKAQNAI